MGTVSDADTPTRVGPYRIDKRLGAGGMGEVYRGFDERLERPVALKHIRAELTASPVLRERFRREARAIARLNHRAIVQIHDWVEEDDGCWYVMELVTGRTLKSLLGDGPLPPAQVIAIGRAIAGGLAAAHHAGIVHRDLKNENVMVTTAGEVKVLDFGLAKSLHQGDEHTLTHEGMVVGTFTSMSPEQAMGKAVDERSDLFSLGILLYEALTGISPFREETLPQTLNRICYGRQTPVAELDPEVPPALSRLIDDLLEKDPLARPASASVVLDRLRDAGAPHDPAADDPLSPDALNDASAVTESLTAYLLRKGGPETDADETPGRDIPGREAGATVSDGGRRHRLRNHGTRDATVPGPVDGHRQAAGSLDVDSGGRRTSERRQITVLAAEVVSARAEPLDAEELYTLQPQLEALARRLAERWECHLERLQDHRLVLCFGYPAAREDEARQAVLAALELTRDAARLESPSGHPLGASVGLHTDLAVVAAAGFSERLVLGRGLDLAVAVQGTSKPGDVVLSAATHGLVERFFDCRREPAVPLTGGEPQPVYRVIAPRKTESEGRDLELVARREELELLLGRWRQARAGEGQVVQLTGEPGIGKSRLIRELGARLEREGADRWILHGTPESRDSPLRPVIRLLHRALELDARSSSDDGLERLESFLLQRQLEPAEVVPHLAPLLSIPLGERYPATDLAPARQRQEIQQTLVALVLATAQRRPLLLVVEDLQWLDSSSLELLALLVEDTHGSPLLLALTCRPEPMLELPWIRSTLATQIHLGRLADDESEELVSRAAGRPVAAAIARLIAGRADGIPLFVEELTRSLVESDKLVEVDGRLELAVPADRLGLPATLRDSLSARLDRLGSAREVAQVAAVFGRSFTPALLAEVIELESEELERALQTLSRSQLVVRRGYGAHRRYDFKHVMIQEAAYDSLLAGERRRLHGKIAAAIEAIEERPELRDRQPERVAHHLEAAGENARAVPWWLAAGELAISRSAHRAGVGHLERGLGLVRALPPARERDQLELALVTRLGAAAGVLHGYAAPEVEKHWRRARELCAELEDSPQLFWALWGLWSFHLVRADLAQALELARRLLRIAEAVAEDDLLLIALGALGLTCYFHGELAPARRHLDRAAALDDPERDHVVASATGQDAGVFVLAGRALVLWHQGEDSAATRSSERAIALAKRVGHAYSLAYARVYAARLHQSRHDLAACAQEARAVIALAEEKGYFWLAQGRFFLGAAESSPEAEGLMVAGLDAYRAAGARLSLTYMLAQLAEHHLRAGELDAAGERLDQADAALETSDERYWQPELLRLRAELHHAEGRSDEAAATLERALALARERGDFVFTRRAEQPLGRGS